MRALEKWYLAVLAALCSGGIALPGGGETIDSAWLAKTRDGAKAAYEKYKAFSARLEEESEYRYEKVPGNADTRPFKALTRRQRVVRLGDNVMREQMYLYDATPKRPLIRLECDNSDYYFTLSRWREDAPYTLIEYALGKRNMPLLRQGLGWHSGVLSRLRHILAAIENDGKFVLQKLQFDNTKGLLLVEYINIVEKGASSQIQLYIDPSHDWRVVERRLENRRAETPIVVSTQRLSYGVKVSGLEFPSGYKSLSLYKAADAPPNSTTTGRLISLKITDKTPEDFRLSAFGFPEPIDAPPLPKPTPWYLWILAAAVASAALAMLFAWLKRRSMKTDALSSEAS